MNIRMKLRHWIALLVAAATMVVGIVSFADFSGEPAPRWREITMAVGPTLTVAMVALNMALDRKGGKPE